MSIKKVFYLENLSITFEKVAITFERGEGVPDYIFSLYVLNFIDKSV